ncbi:MAG: hypothetical protein RLY20_1310 [Verrucomicrobiota bacterium]|jgi:tRNA(Ile)-lysidine synthase
MVLLQLLHSLAPEFGWKLSVAHFNHRLRARSSTADEAFVRAEARRLKLPCDVGSAKVRQSIGSGTSLEMAAREHRHRFLARCARLRGARWVVLAHHADDQVELFLMRLMRGAGNEGLAGMKWRNASPADRSVSLVRPLLGSSKEEIVTHAREQRIRFRQDASNASVEFERNWVRLKLLPLLRRQQPAVAGAILRTMEIAGAEADFVSCAAEEWLKAGGRRRFGDLPLAVQRRVVLNQLRQLGITEEFDLVEGLRTGIGKPISAVGMSLVCDEHGIVRREKSEAVFFKDSERSMQLWRTGSPVKRALGVAKFGGLLFRWRVFKRVGASFKNRKRNRELFDAERVGARLRFRHWQPGDRFQPIGMSSAVKLQDWFTNRKIPAARRRELVLAETEREALFWVQGERIGEVAKVTPTTRWLLELNWKQV